MPPLSPERWAVVSPYLDQALDTPAEERVAWLESLRRTDRALADDLLALLEAHEALAGKAFLETGCTIAPEGAIGAGRTIGAYTLLEPIGSGGMGTVWLARRSDGRFERRVAVKFPGLVQLGVTGGERFKREGRILGRLSHPHIAELIDAGVDADGRPYLVLEHVDGEPIDQYCDRKRLDTDGRLRLFLGVLEAVEHAHANLVVHRDIKPSNVLVTTDGRVKLLDFGIASLLEGAAGDAFRTEVTREGGGAMTLAFAAPEQLSGGPITIATDIHALGVLLYLLLTGEHPFGPAPASPAALIQAIVGTEPRRPSDVVAPARGAGGEAAARAERRGATPERFRRQLCGDLDTIVLCALKKDPRERYRSASDLAADARRHLAHQPVLAAPPDLVDRARKFVRRHRLGVTAAGLVFAGLVAFGATLVVQTRAILRERARSERVSAFMVGLFSLANPYLARGSSLTVREVLDRGAERVEKELVGEPEVQAALMETMGHAYSDLGLYGKAEHLLATSAGIRARVLGEEHPLTLLSRHLLAWAIAKQGRLAEAERLQTQVLAARTRVLGKDDRDTLKSQNNLAVTFELEERSEEAGRLYRQVFEARRRVFGNDDKDTIMSEHNLGFNLVQQLRFADAEPLLRESATAFERVASRDDPDTLNARKNLAQALEGLERYPEEEAILRGVLDGRRRVLGSEHADTWYTESLLAGAVAEQKRYGEAESLYRDALENMRRVQGPDHHRTIMVAEDMALRLYWLAGEYDKAAGLLRGVYDATGRVHDDPFHARTAYNLASLMSLSGGKAEALEWLRKAVASGYTDKDHMRQDPDLAPLHDDPEFERLIAALK